MTQPLAIQNLKYCEETLALKEGLELGFLTLGERLLRIRDERLHAPQWEDFDEFVAELKMAPSTVSRLIGIYQKLVLEYKIAPAQIGKAGGWTVVAEVFVEAKTGVLQRDCKHADTYTIKICRDCGERTKE